MRRFVFSAAVVSAAVLAIGGVASAHIDPDPTEAQAGSRLTVGFTVEHGCEGSPTVQLDMRLPEGVTDEVVSFAESRLTDEVLGVREQYLVSSRRVLDETHGGLQGYLDAAEVTPRDIHRLRAELLG